MSGTSLSGENGRGGVMAINQKQFQHLLYRYWQSAGRPMNLAQFVSDAIAGGHNQARRPQQKSPLEYNQEREKRLTEQGLCVRCGRQKPDGVRSKVRCTVCLDRCKVSQAKYNARMEAAKR